MRNVRTSVRTGSFPSSRVPVAVVIWALLGIDVWIESRSDPVAARRVCPDPAAKSSVVARPGAEQPAVVRDETLTLVHREGRGDRLDQHLVERRRGEPLVGDLVEM